LPVHSLYMQLALDVAWKNQFLTYPNPAVGALLLGAHGEIISIASHEEAGLAHGEVKALQIAYHALTKDETVLHLLQSSEIHDYLKKYHNNIFHDCTLYTTLAPCHHEGRTPSCSSLILAMGIKKVVVGSIDPHSEGGIDALIEEGVHVEVGIEKEACDDLLEPFLAWKAKRPFSFFKLAQHLNGTINGGVITNSESRYHVHELRSVVETLMIGGHTVREDRPILDSRMCETGKNPDIMIYSKSKEFDESIPLFNVKNRRVSITDDKAIALSSAFTMIEGGPQSFEALKDDFDWILLYVSATMSAGLNLQSSVKTKIMHISSLGDNKLLWMKKIKG
jgi:diaminohydroxyphosphoribosylaminopyrimidine deaminase / 5-amino-6-(5-phosphoribosylamino)uracil reductase